MSFAASASFASNAAPAPPRYAEHHSAATAAAVPAAAGHHLAGRPRRPFSMPSAAPAFVCRGWLFPAGLNRKERRRVMFTDEVDPAAYPGAIFCPASGSASPVSVAAASPAASHAGSPASASVRHSGGGWTGDGTETRTNFVPADCAAETPADRVW